MRSPSRKEIRLSEGGRPLKGDNFQVYPGVLDTDSVLDPGVASRLIWSTILPRDEENFHRTFPASVDEPEATIIKGVQEMVYALAEYRAYRAHSEVELARLREDHDRDKRKLEDYAKRLDRLTQENSRLKTEVRTERDEKISLENERKHLIERKENHKSAVNELTERCRRQASELSQLRSQLAEVKDQLAEAKDRESSLLGEVEELRVVVLRPASETRRIREEAVREYRSSKDCHTKKELYSAGFVKHGFYLARSLLEEKRPGESFPELLYTEEVEAREVPDWHQYEPFAESPKTYFARGLIEYMDNLGGPWSPYQSKKGENQASGVIDALIDLDEEAAPTPPSNLPEAPSDPKAPLDPINPVATPVLPSTRLSGFEAFSGPGPNGLFEAFLHRPAEPNGGGTFLLPPPAQDVSSTQETMPQAGDIN